MGGQVDIASGAALRSAALFFLPSGRHPQSYTAAPHNNVKAFQQLCILLRKRRCLACGDFCSAFFDPLCPYACASALSWAAAEPSFLPTTLLRSSPQIRRPHPVTPPAAIRPRSLQPTNLEVKILAQSPVQHSPAIHRTQHRRRIRTSCSAPATVTGRVRLPAVNLDSKRSARQRLAALGRFDSISSKWKLDMALQ
jgi:hypothetical protein